MRSIQIETLFAMASLAVWVSFAQQRLTASRTNDGALYLVGNRAVTRIDLQTGTKKEWPLLAVAGMKEGDICSARHVPITCDWSASNTLLDAVNKRLYFAAPTTVPGDEPESEEDGGGRGPFAVWAVDLESMKLLKKIDVPTTPESMILTSDGKQLLVSYDIKPLTVDTFDTTTFAKISSVKNAGMNQLDTYFTPGSYFLPDGKYIVSGGDGADFRIRVTAGRFQQEFVDPRAQLSAAQKQKLSEFLKTEPDGQKLLACIPASSRNGKTLMFVMNDAMTKTGFWTLDMETGATSGATVTDYFARAGLIGSGEEFATFEAAPKKLPLPVPHNQTEAYVEAYEFALSGHAVIYDSATGKRVREFNNPKLVGAGAVLCLSPDGLLAAFAQGLKVSLLDINSGDLKPLATIQDLPEPGYSGGCGFAK
ncbi:MAG TPA: hypothetical protein VMD76_04735 [Candidatus Sulfotelmatobacter sp.]|nr:hypothetical protein [Candidatus Sulfotelmatobacter sp.]